MQKAILDTGALIAFLNKADRYHLWAVETSKTISPPLITCEAVLAESFFLIEKAGGGMWTLFDLIEREIVSISFSFSEMSNDVKKIMNKYADLPASFTDACLVAMSTVYADHKIFTTDSHFQVYRRKNNQIMHLLTPY